MKKLRQLNTILQNIIKTDKWEIKRFSNTPTVEIYFNEMYVITTQISEQSKTKFIVFKRELLRKLLYYALFYPITSGLKVTCKLRKKEI